MMKSASTLPLLHTNGLEEQCLAFHVDVYLRQFPKARFNFGLANVKLSTAVEMSQQATSELYIVNQVARDLLEPLLLCVHPDLPLHGMKYASLTRRWLELCVGDKVQFDEVATAFSVTKA